MDPDAVWSGEWSPVEDGCIRWESTCLKGKRRFLEVFAPFCFEWRIFERKCIGLVREKLTIFLCGQCTVQKYAIQNKKRCSNTSLHYIAHHVPSFSIVFPSLRVSFDGSSILKKVEGFFSNRSRIAVKVKALKEQDKELRADFLPS